MTSSWPSRILKSCAGDGWRTVLELTLVANMNYSPFGSGSWFFKKKAKLQDFLMTRGVNSHAWNNFQHLICQERRLSEPSNLEEAQELFTEMASLQSFATKGPLVKLMRWFSFFESMAFLDGEFTSPQGSGAVKQQLACQERES